jgi:hypothetical protein
LAVVRPWRRMVKRAALLFVGLLPLVLGYLIWVMTWFHTFNFVTYNSEFLYGRIAPFANCAGLSLPSYERSLCPTQPPAQRNPDFYMWAPTSPQVLLQPTATLSKGQIIYDFDLRIIRHQPLAYLKAVAGDVLYSFSPVRGDGPEHYPASYHQFQTYFYGDKDDLAAIWTYTGHGPHLDKALADFLAGYGGDFYVPGPLLAAGLALGVAGLAGLGRARGKAREKARRSRLRGPCLLFTLGTIFLIVPPFIIATFDWRYELPQLSLIPVAAALGVMALRGADSGPILTTGQDGTGRLVGAGLAGQDGQSPPG